MWARHASSGKVHAWTPVPVCCRSSAGGRGEKRRRRRGPAVSDILGKRAVADGQVTVRRHEKVDGSGPPTPRSRTLIRPLASHRRARDDDRPAKNLRSDFLMNIAVEHDSRSHPRSVGKKGPGRDPGLAGHLSPLSSALNLATNLGISSRSAEGSCC